MEWSIQHQNILKSWAEKGKSYQYMHDRAYKMFKQQNFRFAIPVIIISTIAGTANFAQESFPITWRSYVPPVIGMFNLIAGLITTISQFLHVAELLEGHHAASISYSKFARNIEIELSLPINERDCDGKEFIAKCRVVFDRLIEQSPDIPDTIINKFSNKFNDKNFCKPDILDIRAVNVYNDTFKEEQNITNKAQEMVQIMMDKKQQELEKTIGFNTIKDAMNNFQQNVNNKKDSNNISTLSKSVILNFDKNQENETIINNIDESIDIINNDINDVVDNIINDIENKEN